MLSLLASLIGLIPGLTNLASTIATKAFDAKVKMFQARTGADRDVAVQALRTAALENHASAERLKIVAGSWLLTALVAGFALPLIVFEWKVVVVDIVLKLGTTDPIRGQVADWAQVIIASLFGSTSAVAVTSMWLNRKNQ
jgi:hypothetical protein